LTLHQYDIVHHGIKADSQNLMLLQQLVAAIRQI